MNTMKNFVSYQEQQTPKKKERGFVSGIVDSIQQGAQTGVVIVLQRRLKMLKTKQCYKYKFMMPVLLST